MSQRRKTMPAVDMEMKAQPSQGRARTTYEAILTAAGEVLQDLGIERFSTNLVCQRAGLTPPALYRYFPNKYALLKELGTRLMAAQDEALLAVIARTGLGPATPAEALARAKERQRAVNRVTAEFPGGPWILRAMRAVPALQEVRAQSVTFAANQIFDQLRLRYPRLAEARLRTSTQLAVEMSYAATEMAFEADAAEAERITHELAVMLMQYFGTLDAAPSGELPEE